MIVTSESLENLINEFSKLPSIGRKTARRLALHLVRQSDDDVLKLSEAVKNVKEKIKFCRICCNITEDEICKICLSPQRDKSILCVVEEPQDVYVIEKTNEFKGLYHVLHGRISPLENIGPDDIKIKELLNRINQDDKQNIKEIILALNPTTEGETTILYLSRLIKPFGMKISRIARGIPIGTDIEFADEITLIKALEGRIYI